MRKPGSIYRLKDALDEATDAAKRKCLPLAELKQQLISLVNEYGSTHSEKSKSSMA